MSHYSYNSYSVLKEKKVEIGEITEWHCSRILNNIKGSLKLKQSFRNPFTFKIVESIKFSIFIQLFLAIQDYRRGDGGTQPHVEITKIPDKPGTLNNTFILKFTDFFSVLHVFTHLSGHAVLPFFSRTIRKCEIEVKVSGAKPLIMTYKKNRETCIIQGSFEVKNEFGVVCSF